MAKLPLGIRLVLIRVWVVRRVWIPLLLLMACTMIFGFVMGNSQATSHYKKSLSEIDETYRVAGDKRRVILEQCLANNDKLTSRLAELGDKTAVALDKLSTERKLNEQDN